MSLNYVVREYASHMGSSKIQILEIEGEHFAILRLLNLPGDVGSYVLGIYNHGPFYEVGVFSHFARFRNEDEIPQWLAVLLLEHNSQGSFGYWAIREMSQEQWAVCVDRVPYGDFTPERLGQTIVGLMSKVATFDQTVIDAKKR